MFQLLPTATRRFCKARGTEILCRPASRAHPAEHGSSDVSEGTSRYGEPMFMLSSGKRTFI